MMAKEEKTEEATQAEETAPANAGEVESEPAAEESTDSADEAGNTGDEPEAGGEADEAAVATESDDAAKADDAGGDKAAPAPADGVDAEDDEPLTPKQRRRLARSAADGPPGPPRSIEERVAERTERRRAAAAARRRSRPRRREKRRGENRTGTPPVERIAAPGKTRVGKVVSDRADKTITVQVERARRHPSYEKIVRRSNTLHAHDERNDARAGDVVKVIETRPLSRTKRWRLVEVMERAR